MDEISKLLILDDDKILVTNIERILSSSFKNLEILKANDIKSAFSILTNNKPNVIISDILLSDGNGIDLLKFLKSKDEYKSIYFILLTVTNDKSYREKAFDLGVDDYILKPFDNEQLIAKIRSALKFTILQEKIIEENKILHQLANELEKELQDMIKLAVKFLQARIPASYDMLKRVASASVWIAESYGESTKEEMRDIEIAAFLSQAGRIFLPDSLLKVPVLTNGIPTEPIMHQVPVSGSEIVSSVRRFKNVAHYIKHIYENFDGTGIPDKLKSWQIPFPSRIIRAVLDYEEYKTFLKKRPIDAIELIKKESQRLYDHRVVILLEHYVKSNENELKIENEIALQLMELKPGMITTRDIYTDKGLKLVPANTKLNESIIQKIININTTDPILGNVYIKN